jgi:Xaa-Pro aminopeptidase
MSKISKLKNLFSKYNIEGYLIPKNDSYFNEFINPREDRLKFISNFTGSAGIAVILKNQNLLFVDGRYIAQAKKESSKNFKIIDITKSSLTDFLNHSKLRIGFDASLTKYSWHQQLKNRKNFIEVPENLIDKIWKKSNTKIQNKAFVLENVYSGEHYQNKLKQVKKILNINNNKNFFISASENICWLLNIRGKDSAYTPVLNSQALLTQKKLYVFCEIQKIPNTIKQAYKKNVTFKEESFLFKILAKNKKKLITIDSSASVKTVNYLNEKKLNVRFKPDPISQLKTKKNRIEIQNTKVAHIYDGVAVAKFIIWLKKQKKINKLSEISAQNKLEKFRKDNSSYLFPSFPTISGFGKNAAIIHYRASKQSNLKFRSNGIYLIDSGGQYKEGTTDITRTIAFGKQSPAVKNIYTKVLKGHLAVKNFNLTKNTTGRQIDMAARKYLNITNLDYAHGTGHGVGYFLNVHESPPSISKYSRDNFVSGQIISNEPGFYSPGLFGMRIENLIYVEENKNKLCFQDLTLAPYEKNLINVKLLNRKEVKSINRYHEIVFELLKSFMKEEELSIFAEQCSPL